jgi:hypothetical protein
MLAELEHAPKIGVRGDLFSPQVRRTGKPLLDPSTGRRKAVERAAARAYGHTHTPGRPAPAHSRPPAAICRAIGRGSAGSSPVGGSPDCSPRRWRAANDHPNIGTKSFTFQVYPSQPNYSINFQTDSGLKPLFLSPSRVALLRGDLIIRSRWTRAFRVLDRPDALTYPFKIAFAQREKALFRELSAQERRPS